MKILNILGNNEVTKKYLGVAMTNDAFEDNKTVRENRVALAQIALENGVTPQKAAEFGSRAADALKQMWADPTNQVNGSMISAVFRDRTSGELKGTVVEFAADKSVKNGVKIDGPEALAAGLQQAAESTGVQSDQIKNYAYTGLASKGPGGGPQ